MALDIAGPVCVQQTQITKEVRNDFANRTDDLDDFLAPTNAGSQLTQAGDNPGSGRLNTRSRSHFVNKFDGKPVLSVPFLTFFDGFGLYRNASRSLMGWYITKV